MSKLYDEMRRNGIVGDDATESAKKTAESVNRTAGPVKQRSAEPVVKTVSEAKPQTGQSLEELIENLNRKMAPLKGLDSLDPETRKLIQDKMQEIAGHAQRLDNHEGRISKLEKDVTELQSSSTVSTAGATKTIPASSAAEADTDQRVQDDYHLLYPRDPEPHHVVQAYYVKLANGKEILRYIESDAVMIANTEEPGKDHRALLVRAWAAVDGLLIRPLSPEESERWRKRK